MLKVLRQKRADLVAEARGLFDLAASENRGLSEAEAARDDAISAEIAALDGQIARAEAHAQRERDQAAIGGGAPASVPASPRAQGGAFRSFGEFLTAVAVGSPGGGPRDPRLTWQNGGVNAGPTGMGEAVGADGGFLVQTDFAAGLLQNMWSNGEVASRIRRIPISAGSNGLRMNGIDETSRANGSRWGGIQTYWTSEAAAITASQPKFKRVEMELEKLTGLLYATDELLADSTALEAYMQQAFSDEFTFKTEDAILNGTGAGMPLGILNSGAVITVSKETSQASATLVAENILKMYARMPAKSLGNAVWFVNQDVLPQLYQLNVKIKNVAGTENVGGIATPQVVFQPPGSVGGSTLGTLMGRPVVPVEYCATLGTVGDIVFADMSQYLGIDKGGVQSASSIHVRFLYNETAFRFTYRFNGQPLWQAPVTPYKGSNTISPFIVLQAR